MVWCIGSKLTNEQTYNQTRLNSEFPIYVILPQFKVHGHTQLITKQSSKQATDNQTIEQTSKHTRLLYEFPILHVIFPWLDVLERKYAVSSYRVWDSSCFPRVRLLPDTLFQSHFNSIGFCLIWFAFVSIFTRIYIFLDVSGFWFVFTSSFGCLKVTKKFNRLCASSTRKNSDFQIFSFSMFAFQLVYTFGLQFVWIVVRIGF